MRTRPYQSGSSVRFPMLLVSLIAALLSIPGSAQAAGTPQPVGVHKLIDNIYEFDYIVPTGKDAYHKVGVHRVVQEVHGQPIPSNNAVFMVHGDAWNFNGGFLGGTSSPYSAPVFLAGKRIDVWGIDLGWTLVPAGTTDFSFMKHWGLQRDIDDLETALTFARTVRAQTGSPGNPLTLLDWSRGGWTGYALLNQESQLPLAKRQVRAYIPVDTFFKVNIPEIKSNVCSFEAGAKADLANGYTAYDNSVLTQIGQLAETDPKGISPVFGAPYTNLQASLTLGAAAFQLGPSYAPFYHYVGGTFPNGDSSAIPDGLRYTKISRWDDFLISASPFEPIQMIADTLGISCGDTHTSFDDHLKDITVPVLYVGAGGGFGSEGIYSLSLLGSTDVSSKVISFFPPDQAAFDFAHVDLWNAKNAQDLVWTPIYNWLFQHGG